MQAYIYFVVTALFLYLLKQIMKTQAQLEAEIIESTKQVQKIFAEQQKRFDALTKTITDLEEAVRNGSNVSPEVEAAFEAHKAALQGLDDSIPDVVVEPPPAPVEPPANPDATIV